MSLSSTATIKAQLETSLGPKATTYFDNLEQFISARISRIEFEEQARQVLESATLIQLHNALIISLFDATSLHRRPPTPPPDAPKLPSRKRKRTLPYQGPDSDDTLRSTRLKQWIVYAGRRERERLRALQNPPPGLEHPRPRIDTDEIVRERGVVLLPERGGPPGGRLPLHLASVSRAPTLQHITDRVTLIAAQHNLSQPPLQVTNLLMLAFEAELKKIISHALSLTSSSHAISSISPSKAPSRTPVLSASSLRTLFTVYPAILPNQSATAMRLALGDPEQNEEEEVALLKDREVSDQRWQISALLGERSTVKHALKSLR